MRASLLKSFYYFLSTLSLRTAHALGGAIGWLFAVIPNKRRRTAQINLRLCFPAMDETQRARLARKNLIEFGKTITEVAVQWACDAEQFNSLVKKVSGEELFKNALRRGKGVILAMPHMGAWEFMGLYCSQRYPLTVMFRPLPMSEFGKIMLAARQRFAARGRHLIRQNRHRLAVTECAIQRAHSVSHTR